MSDLLNLLHVGSTAELIWLAIGFGGQLLFSARFLVQWITSERSKRSVMPVAFWYFSIAGSIVLLSYAIYRLDPVFIMGQLFGFVIYARNLMLIRREARQAQQAG